MHSRSPSKASSRKGKSSASYSDRSGSRTRGRSPRTRSESAEEARLKALARRARSRSRSTERSRYSGSHHSGSRHSGSGYSGGGSGRKDYDSHKDSRADRERDARIRSPPSAEPPSSGKKFQKKDGQGRSDRGSKRGGRGRGERGRGRGAQQSKGGEKFPADKGQAKDKQPAAGQFRAKNAENEIKAEEAYLHAKKVKFNVVKEEEGKEPLLTMLEMQKPEVIKAFQERFVIPRDHKNILAKVAENAMVRAMENDHVDYKLQRFYDNHVVDEYAMKLLQEELMFNVVMYRQYKDDLDRVGLGRCPHHPTMTFTEEGEHPTLQIFKYGHQEKKFALLEEGELPEATTQTSWDCQCMSSKGFYKRYPRKAAEDQSPDVKEKGGDSLFQIGTKMGSMEIQLADLKEKYDTARAEIVRLKGHNSMLLEALQEKEDSTEKAQAAMAEVIEDMGETLLLLRQDLGALSMRVEMNPAFHLDDLGGFSAFKCLARAIHSCADAQSAIAN